jgi:hypothetical protein
MADAGRGVVETFFDRLNAYDWEEFGALLSPRVERIGFLGDVVDGREAYVERMAGGPSSASGNRPQATWDVHDIAYASDGRTGFARITARMPGPRGELLIEQALAFKLEENGLISKIEAFWRTTDLR